jgi:unsaturated rhamnogalacturonyl hydrolase
MMINEYKLSEKIVDSYMKRNPEGDMKWSYGEGVILKGFENVYRKTSKKVYLEYIELALGKLISDDGIIEGYSLEEYNIDSINNGKNLFILYEETQKEKYKKAMDILKKQLDTHPRTTDGLFWHKNIYPHQVWLDGIFMGDVFYCQYIKNFGNPADFDDVTKQFLQTYEHNLDVESGLLYHGYDESRQQFWCNKDSGVSPNLWGRGIGWYVMAIVDMLDYLPKAHKHREKVIQILLSVTEALIKIQDSKSKVWYQILDCHDRKGNYLESSATAMFIYAIAKGINNGYISRNYTAFIKEAYEAAIEEFITITNQGLVNVNKVCKVAGLGATDKRDGSFAYYISEPIVCNDSKGVGSFILAACEVEKLLEDEK